MKTLSVGVVGCGTAGSAAAVFLARAGHAVTLYERVPEPGPVGAGITLQPSGQSVLAELGLLAEVAARGAPIRDLVCDTTAGKRVFALGYELVDDASHGLGLHRGVLFESLFAALHRAGVTPRLGCDVRAMRQLPRSRVALVDVTGAEHGPHDLVVVADGARSSLRHATSLPQRVERYPWGALWIVAPEPDGASGHTLRQVVRGNRRMVGMLPTGLGPASRGGTTPLVSLFYSVRVDAEAAIRAAGVDAWRAEVRELAPHTEAVLEQVHDFSQILFSAYHDVVMYPWNTKNVVILGDAAHATSPQLGQGANLALIDARELARVLDEHDFLPRALDAYSRERRLHLAYYQLATRWLTPFFQHDAPLLGALRDLGMPLMGRVPPAARLMARSMAGVVGYAAVSATRAPR